MNPSSSSSSSEVVYSTKVIGFLGRNVPIILQNHNGPCALVSICNVLSLNNKLQLDPSIPEVPETQLLSLVADRLIDLNSKFDNKDPDYVKKQQQKIDDAIALLPRLTTGVHVNIKFTRINDFEFTPEREIFDLLDIPLYHGWIVDPQDIETKNAIGSKSHDFLMDELVSLAQAKEYERIENLEEDSVAATTEARVSSPSLSRSQSFTDSPQRAKKGDMEEAEQILRALKLSMAEASKRSCESAIENSECVLNSSIGVSEPIHEGEECIMETGTAVYQNPEPVYEEEVVLAEQVDSGCIDVDPKERLTVAQGKLFRNYMESNATQLTAYGLFCLKNELEEHKLCVLFRNDHFNTMFKYEGELYLLASDQAFINQPDRVWEKLNKVNGDNVHVMANFKEFKRHSHGSCNEDNIASITRLDSNTNSDLQLPLSLDLQQSLQPAASGSGLITGPQVSLEEEGVCIGYSSFKSYAVAYGRWKASTFTKWLDKFAFNNFQTFAKYRVALMALTEARKEKGILEATLRKVKETMLNQTQPWMIIELENLLPYGHILVADLDDVKALSFLKVNLHFRCGVILGMWRSPTILATDPAVKAALDELGIEHRMGESSFEAGRAFQKFCRRLAAYLLNEEDVKRLTVQFEEAKESFNVAETEFERLRREVRKINYMQSRAEPLHDKMKLWIQFLLTCNHIILDSVDDVEPFYHLMAHDGYEGDVHTFSSAIIEEFKNHAGYKRFVQSGMTLCYCHGRQSRLTFGHPHPVELDAEERRERWKKEDEEAWEEMFRRHDNMPEEWLDEHPRG